MPDLQPPDLRVQAPAGPSAAQSFAQGFDTGTGITGVVNAAQDRQTLLQQQEIARKQAIQMQVDLANVANNPNASAGDYARLMTLYPQIGDKIKQGFDVLSQDQQQAKINSVAPVYAAVKAGDSNLALKLMDDHINALQNSGASAQDVGTANAWKQVVQQHPQMALSSMAVSLAAMMGPQKFESTFGKLGEERRADAKLPVDLAKGVAETQNTQAQAQKTTAEAAEVAPNAAAQRANLSSEVTNRADRLSLDRDKLESEVSIKLKEIEAKNQFGGNLPESARKIVNDSVTQATISRNTAAQARGLADQFDNPQISNGLTGMATNKFKELTGNENYWNQLRNEYSKIRATAVRAGIPQGPASDKDVAFASKGFLSDTADPKTIASFLRGMAGMQEYNARYENIRAEWAQAVGNLGKTTRDIEIDGVKVPAGYTLDDFVKKRIEQPAAVSPPAAGAETNYQDKYKNYGKSQPQAPQG